MEEVFLHSTVNSQNIILAIDSQLSIAIYSQLSIAKNIKLAFTVNRSTINLMFLAVEVDFK